MQLATNKPHPMQGKFANAELCPVIANTLNGPPGLIPEKVLWFAVLYRAMCDYVHGKSYEHVFDWPVQEDARRWFRSKSTETGSYLWIMAHLDMSPGHMETIMLQINSPTFKRMPQRMD